MENLSPFRGTTPFGWEPDKVAVNATEAQLVRDAAQRLLATEDTVYNIVADWNQAGVRSRRGEPWNGETLKRYLCRPRLAGLLVRNGVVVGTGPWQAILDRPTWEAVRARVSRRGARARHYPAAVYLGTNIAVCGTCGQVMEGHLTPAEGSKYRCRGRTERTNQGDGLRHPQVKASDLDSRIRDGVLDVLTVHGTDLVEARSVEAVNYAIGALAQAKATVLDLAADYRNGLTGADARARLQMLEHETRVLEQERDDAALKAALALLPGTRDRTTLAAGWDALDLASRRVIASRLVVATVYNGAGPGRVAVEGLLA